MQYPPTPIKVSIFLIQLELCKPAFLQHGYDYDCCYGYTDKKSQKTNNPGMWFDASSFEIAVQWRKACTYNTQTINKDNSGLGNSVLWF